MNNYGLLSSYKFIFVLSKYLTMCSSIDSADDMLQTHLAIEAACSFAVFYVEGRGKCECLCVFRKW